MRDHDQDAIEVLIDKYGIGEFIHYLANICYKKAEHLDQQASAVEWKRLALIFALMT